MTHIQPDTTVGDLVATRPEFGTVFERLGIDYCCGGKKSLADACGEKQLDVTTLIATLEASDAASEHGDKPDPAQMSLAELVDHIIKTHHDYLRQALPPLSAMIDKVAGKHREHNPKLTQLPRLMQDFTAEIMSHMMKEERMLFPAICQLEKARTKLTLPFGSIANPIGVMEAEHESAGNALEQFRALTDSYTVPEWGCNTYRSMVAELEKLEQNMHRHVHKENNILFPRAIELEAELSSK